MIIYFFLSAITKACESGEIEHEEGCVAICLNAFYNTTTQQCDQYKQCEADQYLNITVNICTNTCMYGYYQDGICICDTGFDNSTGSCQYDHNANIGPNYTLGLDWFY